MQYVMLKDICDINMGQSPSSESYNENKKGMPFFQGNADFGERYPIARKWSSAPTKIAEAGDILISVRAPIGAVNYATERCCIGRGLAALTPNKCKASSEFIFWLLKAKHDELNSKGTGSTFKAVGRKVLEEILVPNISLEKQIKYSKNLEEVYLILQSRKMELEKLDELIKSRFVEMFGNPIINTKGWPKKRFDEICENLDSRRKPITASEREAGRYPYYGASGVVDYVANYIFDEDLLLVSEDGANLLMRSTPIAFSVSGKVWVNNHAHVVRFKEMSMQKYIEIYFSMIDISDQITGSAQPKLNQAKLNAIRFAIPNEALLDEYYDFIKKVDKSKVIVQKSLDETQLLFDSLMQKYFG